jgi:hypothetical protein
MNLRHLSVTFIALLLLITGCASNKAPTLSSAAKAVRVVKADPDGNYQELGPITATDGSGCGLFGSTGTYDNAVFKIKALAAKRGGDYVQIFNLREPYFRPGCFDNAYVVSGTLFKKTAGEIVKAKPQTKSVMSVYSKLRELKKLQTEGVITTEEFESQKK